MGDPPESATKVGHPAPFPVELPTRLIELYSYEGDLILDPFLGSGSAAVAALRPVGTTWGSTPTPATWPRRTPDRQRAEALGRIRPAPCTFRSGWNCRPCCPRPGPRTPRAGPCGRVAGEGSRPDAARVLWVRRHPGRREGAGIGYHRHSRGHRPDRYGVGLRRGLLHVEPGRAVAPDALWKSLGKAAVAHQGGFDRPRSS